MIKFKYGIYSVAEDKGARNRKRRFLSQWKRGRTPSNVYDIILTPCKVRIMAKLLIKYILLEGIEYANHRRVVSQVR